MLRRCVIAASLATLVLSALLWGLSLPAITYREPRGLMFVADLRGGLLTVHNGGSYTRPGWQRGPRTRLLWWPYDGSFARWRSYPGRGPSYRFVLPLWMPAVLSASVLGAGWRLRPRAPGACPCGYSRKGLAADAPCPECGLRTAPTASGAFRD